MCFVWFLLFLCCPVIFGGPCGAEDDEMVFFELQQLSLKTKCPQLTQDECQFLHDATDNCPCTCERRLRGIDPDGIGNDDDQSKGTGGGGFDEDTTTMETTTYVSTTMSTEDLMAELLKRFSCFHGDMLLDTPTGQQTISDLVTVKDAQVLSWNRAENTLQYSPIKYWLHAKPEVTAPYLRISTGETNLLITGNHLIYRLIDCNDENADTVFARELQVGHCVMTKTNNTIQISPITSIHIEYKEGIYAPVTEQGSLVVNGVVASCFAENSNESLQKLIHSYILFARNVLESILPESLFNLLLGSNNDVSAVYWAFERFQRSFL